MKLVHRATVDIMAKAIMRIKNIMTEKKTRDWVSVPIHFPKWIYWFIFILQSVNWNLFSLFAFAPKYFPSLFVSPVIIEKCLFILGDLLILFLVIWWFRMDRWTAPGGCKWDSNPQPSSHQLNDWKSHHVGSCFRGSLSVFTLLFAFKQRFRSWDMAWSHHL